MKVCLLLYAAHATLVVWVALREARHPGRGFTWCVLATLLPFLGPALYAVAARPVPRRPLARTAAAAPIGHQSHLEHPLCATMASAIARLTGNPAVPGRVSVLTNGPEKYDRLLEALQRARRSIDIEYYIFRDDHVGRSVMRALIERAEAGVTVRFLRDGLGSRSLPHTAIAQMAAAGIQCRTFFPLRFPWLTRRLNHRDHCKIVVIDGEEAFVGGINVGDEYTGRSPRTGFWRDTHLHLTGPVVAQLAKVFQVNWRAATPDGHGQRKPRAARLAMLHAFRAQWMAEWGADLIQLHSEPETWFEAYVQTVESGPDTPAENVRHLFFLCLTGARRTVDITTPYFVPDRDIVMALQSAALRGVRVRLLVPARVDHPVVGWASWTYYEELCNAGVEVYLYERGVLHAKVMTADDRVAVVGAANYDMRSFRLSYEIATVVYSQEAVRSLTDQFERDLADSTRLTAAGLRQRAPVPAWLQQAARVLAPLL